MTAAADPVPMNQRRRIGALRLLALAVLPVVLLAAPRWGSVVGPGHEALELAGLALLLGGGGRSALVDPQRGRAQ